MTPTRLWSGLCGLALAAGAWAEVIPAGLELRAADTEKLHAGDSIASALAVLNEQGFASCTAARWSVLT